ncbi:MAG: HD domain-containing phosphohydrolase [Candidatus Eisenbacteria bacterium]
MRETEESAALAGARVLVVEDDPAVQGLLVQLLRRLGCTPIPAACGECALERLHECPPDAVLLDVHLPGLGGHEFLEALRGDVRGSLVPVIVITGSHDRQDRLRAVGAGASAFLVKPFDAEELGLRLRSLLRVKRLTDHLEESGRVMVSLARTLEARDLFTSGHSERVSCLAGRLGARLGMTPSECTTLEEGGLVHDIGKVGIRDGLLLKAGPLEPDERRELQRHPEIGIRLVESLFTMAHTQPVIRWHHERMDGSGYPDHLTGGRIPTVARVTAIADVYDALTSPRPYRAAFAPAVAYEIMREEVRRGLLDRELFQAFVLPQ